MVCNTTTLTFELCIYGIFMWENILSEFIVYESAWPSGLRRCVQVAVWFSRRGFESHF